jgi:1,4-dihydroxy-2-naphthoate octaprenyltransferase
LEEGLINKRWLQAMVTVPSLAEGEWQQLDGITKWLIASRASVLLMTFMSAALGGLLAARYGDFQVGAWLLCTLGLLLAHATNNLLNDYTDSRRGIDEGNYFRNQYGVHVLEDGLLSPSELMRYIVLTGAAALVVGAWLIGLRGGMTAALMLAGAFFVLFYTWPLKYLGLGEPAVLLVWGPLMVGGTCYVISGVWNETIVWLSLLYALGPTCVLFGKHIDKLELDRSKGVRTLPVMLGERLSRRCVQGMLILQYLGCLLLVVTGQEHWILLAVFLALPVLIKHLKIFTAKRPETRPAYFPENLWPLWFAPNAFAHTRRFTPLFIGALLASVVIQSV